jgi:Fe-S-cluster containining protein
MDLEPLQQVHEIEITEEHITITYNQRVEHYYNTDAVVQREWSYKYNDDPEFVKAVRGVIDAARKHLRDMPENASCPPGCAECCSGYEPFVSREDVQRIADHLGMTYRQTFEQYVVARESADGYVVGYLRKVGDDLADQCIFLKGPRSGAYYCGIYEARPHDCRAFTPVGCDDVDVDLPRTGEYKVGPPFRPRRPAAAKKAGRRRTRR